MVNYWIFVLTEYSNFNYGSMDDALREMQEEKKWKIGLRTPHRNQLMKGDKVVFYASGVGRKCFVASADLDSEFLYDNDPIFGHVLLSNISIYTNPIYIKPLLRKLNFIKNKNKWGVYFQGGIVSLNDKDYIKII